MDEARREQLVSLYEVVGDIGAQGGGHEKEARHPQGHDSPSRIDAFPGNGQSPLHTVPSRAPMGLRPTADHDTSLTTCKLNVLQACLREQILATSRGSGRAIRGSNWSNTIERKCLKEHPLKNRVYSVPPLRAAEDRRQQRGRPERYEMHQSYRQMAKQCPSQGRYDVKDPFIVFSPIHPDEHTAARLRGTYHLGQNVLRCLHMVHDPYREDDVEKHSGRVCRMRSPELRPPSRTGPASAVPLRSNVRPRRSPPHGPLRRPSASSYSAHAATDVEKICPSPILTVKVRCPPSKLLSYSGRIFRVEVPLETEPVGRPCVYQLLAGIACAVSHHVRRRVVSSGRRRGSIPQAAAGLGARSTRRTRRFSTGPRSVQVCSLALR